MSRMVRKQAYIERRHNELLKRRARDLGVSEAAVIRTAIELATRVSLPWLPDLQAWEDEKAFIERRRRITVPQTGRTWTRDELYDERLQQRSH